MRKLLLALLLLVLGAQAHAQMLHPVKWSFDKKLVAPNVYDLYFTAHIEKGWHVYSQNNNPNEGPVPTTFTFKKSSAYKLEGKVTEVTPAIKAHDPNFDLDVQYFEKEAKFKQRVNIAGAITKITGTLNYMSCNDNMCLPPEDVDFSFEINDPGTRPGNQPADKAAPEIPLKSKEAVPQKPAGDDKGTGMFTPGTDDGFQQDASSAGGIVHPVKWSYEAKSLGNNEYELRYTANIESGYHIYGLKKIENGPIATSIELDDNSNVKAIGELTSASPVTTEHDPILKVDIEEYSGQVVFTQKIQLEKPAQTLTGTVHYQSCDNEKCFPPEDEKFSMSLPESVAKGNTEEVKATEPGLLFLSGFGGGLLALLTPCVFPMIPLTVSFFTKRSEKKKNGVGTALLFGLSIVLIFELLGILVSLMFHDSSAVYNLATNGYMNMFFFLVFMVFAFSFLGAFELTLPNSWANKADANSEKQGLIGVFFMAFTLVIVSFSCTAPIVGNLLVAIVTGKGFVGPIAGMGGFALAFAMPFVLFAIFPTLMQQLPKSGGWLNAVKVVFGFVELAFAFKFLSNVDLAYHWGIMKREYFLAIWIIIAVMLGFYLLGKLKLSHDTPLDFISVPRLLLAIAAFAFAAYMVPGLFGAPLKILSGLAPPHQYNEGFIAMPMAESSPGGGNTSPQNNETRKYSNIFKSPHGLNAYFDYNQALKAAKAAHKPLMIDFTGWSCANCRKMEENVWVSPAVFNMLKNDYILVSLYVDDRTDLPDSEIFHSKTLDRDISTLGGKWLDMQAGRYGVNAQPYYVLLDNNEQELTKPVGGYDPEVQHFADFLAKGKSEYEKRQQTGMGQMAKE